MADAQPVPSDPNCTTCGKTPESDKSHSQCSGCHTVRYCSKDCQKANWKDHKHACLSCPWYPKGAQYRRNREGNRHAQSFNTLKDALWEGKNSWLHTRPEEETYGLLIDSYRLRVEDEYNFRGDAGGLYAGEDPVPGFRDFLKQAERKDGVLPPWWNGEKKAACVRKGSREAGWGSLHAAVEKSDIMEHYGDNSMPMQLRMLAEEIIGSNVMGRPRAIIRLTRTATGTQHNEHRPQTGSKHHMPQSSRLG